MRIALRLASVSFALLATAYLGGCVVRSQPGYVQAQPVYVQPRPVYVQPRPVYVQTQPVYVAPLPTTVYVR